MDLLTWIESLNLNKAQSDALFSLAQWVDIVWLKERQGYEDDNPNVSDFSDRLTDPRYVELLGEHASDHGVDQQTIARVTAGWG